MKKSSEEKAYYNENYKILEKTPTAVKQIARSKMTQETLDVEMGEGVSELQNLVKLFEKYKDTGENVFISKAEEYLDVWAKEYDPILEKGVQISLDQRHFASVFANVFDCWDGLSDEAKNNAVKLAAKVLDGEEKFWETGNHKHNNRYSYSLYTKITGYSVLYANNEDTAIEKLDSTIKDFYKQVRENVYDDASTLDFKERDSVHYQVFNQIAWERINTFLTEHGSEVPDDIVNKLSEARNFALQYITGDKEHIEFVNSTHVRDKEIQGEKFAKVFDKDSKVAKQLLELMTG